MENRSQTPTNPRRIRKAPQGPGFDFCTSTGVALRTLSGTLRGPPFPNHPVTVNEVEWAALTQMFPAEHHGLPLCLAGPRFELVGHGRLREPADDISLEPDCNHDEHVLARGAGVDEGSRQPDGCCAKDSRARCYQNGDERPELTRKLLILLVSRAGLEYEPGIDRIQVIHSQNRTNC